MRLVSSSPSQSAGLLACVTALIACLAYHSPQGNASGWEASGILSFKQVLSLHHHFLPDPSGRAPSWQQQSMPIYSMSLASAGLLLIVPVSSLYIF